MSSSVTPSGPQATTRTPSPAKSSASPSLGTTATTARVPGTGAEGSTGASGVTEIRWGRPASMPASMAAPTSATCTWTFHSRPVGVSTPTTTRLSPSAARRSCRRATASSSVSASRYWTSLPGPAGGWCGRCSPECVVRGRGRDGRAAGGPARRRSPSSPGRRGPGRGRRRRRRPRRRRAGRRAGSGVASRATRAPSAAARTTSARSGRPSSTAATAASAPARATVRKVPFLGVGDRGVGGVGRLLQGGGEGRTVGRGLAGELVGEAAQELGEDGAGVAAGTEDGAAGEHRPGGLGGARALAVERGDGGLGGEQEVGAGVAVGHREDVEVVEPAAGLGQDVDRGPVPLTDRCVVQRLQHGRRVPMTGDRTGSLRRIPGRPGASGGAATSRRGAVRLLDGLDAGAALPRCL